jgi:hypothetical protein
MKPSIIPVLCALLAPSLAPAASTVVNLNGGFNTVSGPGVLSVADGLSTSFGTTTSFGISDIGGVSRDVLSFAAIGSATQGLNFLHNSTSPTTTGYSLLMDVYFTSIPNYVSFAQLDNAGDGDVFGRSSGAIGISGDYAGTAFTASAWHRVVITVDLPTTTLSASVNGVEINNYAAISPDRYDLGDPSFLLFGDEDGETAAGYISQFAFIDRTLSAPEILSLGGATAAPVPEPTGALLLALAGVAGVLRRRR